MDAIRKIDSLEKLDWSRNGMRIDECGSYVRAQEATQALASKDAEIARLREDLLALQMFTDSVIGEFPDHGDIDGFDLQDIAVACGLLKEETITAPCGEHCSCFFDADVVGQCQCYRVQPVMHRARSASEKHRAALTQPTE